MCPTSPTHSLTVSHRRGKDRKGESSQRQKRESSLWDWPRDRGEKAACGTGPETEDRKQHVELALRQRRENSLWNWPRQRRERSLWDCPRDRGEKAACGTGPEAEAEERKQPVDSQKRGSSLCVNLVIIFQLVRLASSSER